ncbi:unnamed protein product [Fusarium graminearum]|nr:unnamed protein product [Fusarium graminearum]
MALDKALQGSFDDTIGRFCIQGVSVSDLSFFCQYPFRLAPITVSPANSLLAAIADTVLRRKKRCWWCLSDQVKRMFEVVLGVDGHRVAYDVVVVQAAKIGTWIALHVRSNYGGVAFDLSSPAVMFEWFS